MKASDQLAEHVKAHEGVLTDARRQRKDTDDQLQALMNRIAYLAQEECKIDKDIESARRRAAEALARQAAKDEDIAPTAHELLATMPSAQQHQARPHTGRSSLLASLRGASLSDGPSRVSVASSIALPGGPPPRVPSASRGSASSATGRPPVPVPTAAAPRALDKSRSQGPSRAPEPAAPRPGTATSKSLPSSKTPSPGKLLVGAPASASGRASRSARTSLGSSGGSHDGGNASADGQSPAATAAAAAAGSSSIGAATVSSSGSGDGLPAGLSAAGAHTAEGMQLLQGPGAAAHAVGGHHPQHHYHAAGGGGGPNTMAVIGSGQGGADGLLDDDLLEELAHGCQRSASSVSSGPSGLQEFSTEEGGGAKRVVQVKATNSRAGAGGRVEGTSTVVAGGVGWGLSSRGAAAQIPVMEAKKLQAELHKKQQIWKVRKTFGLEPTPMSDVTAQVEEVGAGAWQ